MTTPSSQNESIPRFSFGSMALSEESDRHFPNNNNNNSTPTLSTTTPLSSTNNNNNTTNSQLDILRQLLITEQHSPELQFFPAEAIGDIRELLDRQSEIVEEIEDEQQQQQQQQSQQQQQQQYQMRYYIMKMEIDRISYILRTFYRCRLQKIEKSIFQLMKQVELLERLSEAEKKYAKTYYELIKTHFEGSFLKKVPERLRGILEEKDGKVEAVPKVDLNRFVCVKAKRDVANFVVSEDARELPFSFLREEVYCVRYKAVRSLLEDESVELV